MTLTQRCVLATEEEMASGMTATSLSFVKFESTLTIYVSNISLLSQKVCSWAFIW